MAIIRKTIAFDLAAGNVPRVVHHAFLTDMSVETVNPVVAVEMAARRRGPFEETTFLTVPRGGFVRVLARRVVGNPEDPDRVDVEFEIRTRADFTGQPAN